MSSTTPLRLGPPVKVDQHAVLMTVREAGGKFRDIEVFRGGWDVAQGVWKALDDARVNNEIDHPILTADLLGQPVLNSFCVRSTDDPRVKEAVSGDRLLSLPLGHKSLVNLIGRKVYAAARDTRHKKLGEIALRCVKDETLDTLGQVIQAVRTECNMKNLGVSAWEVVDAVKARVILGRAYRRESLRREIKGTGYFIRKSDGPLHKVTVQGKRLAQSSMAYHGTFNRLIKNDDGTFRVAQ